MTIENLVESRDSGCDNTPPARRATDAAEEQRLATLESLQIVHTLPEDAYERIVRRTSEFFRVPMCTISMVGRNNHWFKAKVGVDVDLVAREASFAEATFLQDDVFVVTDPCSHARFAHHPGVVGPPHIRFYAGVPLVIEGGHKIGTLSIADTRARHFDAAAQEALKDFGALVVDELHLRLRTMRLEAQLEQQRRADAARVAEQRERADFLAMVAHELRAPLNAIAGIAGLIGHSEAPSLDRVDVDALRASTEHLVRMINEVLELARLEATAFTFQNEPFDLGREVHRALAMVQPGAAAKDLRLRVDIDASVPARVCGDRTRVAQIVMNLVTNAVKFTSQGSVDVTLSAREAGKERVVVTLRVEDTGIGMSADATQDLFKTFSQCGPEVRARYGGTGLGLAICRKLVTAMKGEISVHSVAGVGTTFSCAIPFGLPAGGEALPAPTAVNDAWRAAQLVLVADDDAVSARITRAMLTRAGYRVETFTNGRDTLAALRARPFDIAIVDLHMPGLDGFALAGEMQLQTDFGAPVPLVALTGWPQPPDDPRVAHFARYLVKPVDAATLDRTIVEVLSMRDRVGAPDPEQ